MDMEKASTHFNENVAAEIVKASGHEIREFFSFLNNPQKASAYGSLKNKDQAFQKISQSLKETAIKFENFPQQFSDECLVENGKNIKQAIGYYARIELRRSGQDSGVAQVAVRGVEGEFREVALSRLRPGVQPHGIDIKLSGKASFEFNVVGVNKALPFIYLNHRLKHVLEYMGYTPGSCLNSFKTETVLAADGDGTTYESPSWDRLPLLSESPVLKPLIDFLSLGGVYMIISGNDLGRTKERVDGAIPRDLKNRVILAANGAATMAIYDKDNSLKEVEDYRENAINYSRRPPLKAKTDVVYIGDDGRNHGNDIDGFKAVGFKRSVLVGDWSEDTLIGLKEGWIPGFVASTTKVVSTIVDMVRNRQKNSILFSDENVATMIARAKAM